MEMWTGGGEGGGGGSRRRGWVAGLGLEEERAGKGRRKGKGGPCIQCRASPAGPGAPAEAHHYSSAPSLLLQACWPLRRAAPPAGITGPPCCWWWCWCRPSWHTGGRSWCGWRRMGPCPPSPRSSSWPPWATGAHPLLRPAPAAGALGLLLLLLWSPCAVCGETTSLWPPALDVCVCVCAAAVLACLPEGGCHLVAAPCTTLKPCAVSAPPLCPCCRVLFFYLTQVCGWGPGVVWAWVWGE